MTAGRNKPRILGISTAAESRLFVIESVRLRFSNGREAEFERVSSRDCHGAVIIVPMIDDKTFLLAREYMVGLDRYEYGFPKGLIRPEEDALDAGNRELMEEMGYRSSALKAIRTLSLAAGFTCYETVIVLARDLKASRRKGDEPEPVEQLRCSLEAMETLVNNGRISDSRSIAALHLVQHFLAGETEPCRSAPRLLGAAT